MRGTGATGADALTKAQRSKQWHTGVGFWDGFTSSVLNGLGLRVTDGVAWIDLLPYDDKLQHSVIQAEVRPTAYTDGDLTGLGKHGVHGTGH